MSEYNKYKDRRYQKRVREWAKQQELIDNNLINAQEYRKRRLGDLATGGRAGLAPGVPRALWDAKVRTDE